MGATNAAVSRDQAWAIMITRCVLYLASMIVFGTVLKGAMPYPVYLVATFAYALAASKWISDAPKPPRREARYARRD